MSSTASGQSAVSAAARSVVGVFVSYFTPPETKSSASFADSSDEFKPPSVLWPLHVYQRRHPLNFFFLGLFTLSLSVTVGVAVANTDDIVCKLCYQVIIRTWQTADKMKSQMGSIEPSGSSNDNFRIKRYIAKYTINPAIANGFSEFVGSVQVGKLADLVIWKPSYFGAKPEMVLKGGAIAWANMGDPNASIPTPEPVLSRPMFGAFGKASSAHSIAFVSKAAKDNGVKALYDLNKRVEAVGNVRNLCKCDMELNDALPKILVDPETYTVTADGEILTCSAATTVPLSWNYFLF